ncbi:helix-turn-helix transcriptional regulator [Saccharopolyspora phatthalungensis]|uniref:DNA-binding CsgD family transcriptional regulator n=1 Tax=Saccharopolyspora phatthalungensis TaxID=664693 RepID=A0A840Q8N4_9PSEU|nr:helix-turn-helix transcriptional regulator [Saccharopolyspora phatthalungensis]MBB5155048.1 DNA-binding CsgD family transcriptional regulator [Saccharopolyspora phatthalungensis]
MPNDSTAASIPRVRRGLPEPEPPWRGPEKLGADEPGRDELVQHLVRALVRRVGELSGPHRAARKPLLDMTELGIRCLLLPIAPKVDQVLSPREREIARMVGLGYTNRSIAAVLDISLYTVSAHMRRIFTKLGVGSRAAMVAALSDNPDLYVAE